jgi:hypothetical protein
MQQQKRAAKPDPNNVRLHDSRHYAKHTRIALAVTFAVFIVLVGGILLWLVLTRGPAIVGDRFIELVSHNKIDRAYVEASAIELRQRLTFEQFTDLVTRLQLTDAKSASWSVQQKGQEQETMLGKVLLNDGSTRAIAVTFIREFDDWKVGDIAAAPSN